MWERLQTLLHSQRSGCYSLFWQVVLSQILPGIQDLCHNFLPRLLSFYSICLFVCLENLNLKGYGYMQYIQLINTIMGNSYYWLFIGYKLTVDIQLIIESHITHFDYTWIQLVVDGILGRRNRRRRRGRGRRLQPNVWTSPLLQTLGL